MLACPVLLHGDSLSVIVADPLVVSRDGLHHRVMKKLWRQMMLLDRSLDFFETQHASELGARTRFAWTRELAAKLLAVSGEPPPIKRKTKVDLVRIQSVRPQRASGVCYLPNVGMSLDNPSSFVVSVPWAMPKRQG